MRKKIIISFACMIFFSCQNKVKKEYVFSDDGENALTIFSKDSEHYIFNGKIESGKIPSTGFVKNVGIEEYFIGIVKWIDGRAHIYQVYGMMDKSKKNNNINVSIISGIRFEKMRDSSEYKYFYY